MSDDDNHDLTRIEDLSEFLHEESEDDSFDLPEPEEGSSSSTDSTDPELQFSKEDLETDQEEDLEGFSSDFASDETDDSDAFAIDDNDAFATDDSDAFAIDDSDAFATDDSDSFATDDSDAFATDDSDAFATDDSDAFATDENDEFATEDTNELSADDSETDALVDIKEEEEEDTPAEDPQEPGAAKVQEVVPKQESQYKEKSTVPKQHQSEEIKVQEDFKDVKKFAESAALGNMASEGNPPFSIIISSVKFYEDIEDILELLKKYKIVTNDNANQTELALKRGTLLIPRVSEYSAIHLCHLLRKYNIELTMGLSDELHPPKSFEKQENTLVSKRNAYQNHSYSADLRKQEITENDIILTTASNLEGYSIEEYINIISESTTVLISDLKVSNSARVGQEKTKKLDQDQIKIEKEFETILQKYAAFNSDNSNQEIKDHYSKLIQSLKPKAMEQKANAVIGISFQLIPRSSNMEYEIICTGNAVWLSKK